MAVEQERLAEIRDRYRTCEEGWRHVYEASLSDLKFVYDIDSGQWPDEIRKDREGRPMLTVNKLLKFVRQLRGEARVNRPTVKVIPVDDQADVKVAELYNGIIRQIEYLSSSDIAYDTGYMNAVSSSVGFWRLGTKYENEYSFNQDIYISRISNPFSVLYDPAPNEFDLSDAKDCFVHEWLSKSDFEAKYPGAQSSDFDGKTSKGKQYYGWFEKEKTRIAEYFYKEYKKISIALVEIPAQEGIKVTTTIELNKDAKDKINQMRGRIVKERETEIVSVKWRKVSGAEILESGDWPGKYIPIIPVFGDEIIVDGKKHLLSLIRGAKGIQQMYNYWSSAATEAVALVPKSPFIVPHKQIEGFENEWEDANRKNRMYIRYKHIQGLQKPSREPQAQIPTAMVAMMQNTSLELEDQLGRYEATKGAASNERSGRAILARVAQSDKGTFTFVDNFSRAIVYTGRQLIDLIPKIYDTERAIRIKGEDGAEKQVMVNQATGRMGIDGKPEIVNDLTVGKYDLIATVGASYSSRRQEALDMLIQTMQYAPQIAPVIAPLIFKYSDWPGAEEISDALKQAVSQLPKEEVRQ